MLWIFYHGFGDASDQEALFSQATISSIGLMNQITTLWKIPFKMREI